MSGYSRPSEIRLDGSVSDEAARRQALNVTVSPHRIAALFLPFYHAPKPRRCIKGSTPDLGTTTGVRVDSGEEVSNETLHGLAKITASGRA